MKRLFWLLTIAVTVGMAGCGDDYDDSEIRGDLAALETRVQALEELCQRMNTNISSLQTLVDALQKNDYITAVTPVKQGTETVGYTIQFVTAGPITIYNGVPVDRRTDEWEISSFATLVHPTDSSASRAAPDTVINLLMTDISLLTNGNILLQSLREHRSCR